MTSKVVGAPLKYVETLSNAPRNHLFTPATLAAYGVARGWIPPEAYQKARASFSRCAKHYGFPEEGDGTVCIPGQPATAGWLGRRWREVSRNKLARNRQKGRTARKRNSRKHKRRHRNNKA
jgi:hypothetical protein